MIVNDDDNKHNKLRFKLKFTEDPSPDPNNQEIQWQSEKTEKISETIRPRSNIKINKKLSKLNHEKGTCLEKHKILKTKEQIQDFSLMKNYKKLDSDECYELISTFIRCDICARKIDEANCDKEKYRRCDNCLTFAHISCLKDCGDKNDSETCRKCMNDKNFEESCFVCFKNTGSMVKCDNSWVHVFCVLLLKNLFYKKHDHMYNWGLDKYKVSKMISQCQVCLMSNCYTRECNSCSLKFHPYCGLLANFDFSFVDKKTIATNDLLNKYEITSSCENHLYYSKNSVSLIKNCSPFEKEHGYPYGKKLQNKEELTYINPIQRYCRNQRIRERKPNLQVPISSPNEMSLLSFNYRLLKKNIFKKLDHLLVTNIQDFDWEIINQFFTPITEYEISLLSKCSEKAIKMEEILSEMMSNKDINNDISNENIIKTMKNYILCKFQKESLGYLAVYDISKVPEIKLNPSYVNSCSELLSESSQNEENFTFLRKRQRSDSGIINFSSKNLKIEESQNLSTVSNTKLKFILEDEPRLSNFNDNLTLTEFAESEGKKNDGVKRLLKKTRLLTYYKMRKKDKKIINLEDETMKILKLQLNENKISLVNVEDIDIDILLKTGMLETILNKNIESLCKLKTNAETFYQKPGDNIQEFDEKNSRKILQEFKSMSRYGFLRRRLTKGCEDKKMEDLIRNRGQNFKTGKTISRDKDEYFEFLKTSHTKNFIYSESDCCICLYSDFEDLSPIVFCDSCNVALHQECYGLKEIPEGNFYCDLCTFKNKTDVQRSNNSSCDKLFQAPTRSKECILCNQSRGALKKIDKNGEVWGHCNCILMSNYLHFSEYEKMETIEGLKSLPNSIIKADPGSKIFCIECKKTTGELFSCFKCQKEGTENKVYFHFFCAYLQGWKIDVIQDSFKKSPKKHEKSFNYSKLFPCIYCDAHNEDKNRDKNHQRSLRNVTYHKDLPSCNMTNQLTKESSNGRSKTSSIEENEFILNIENERDEESIEKYKNLFRDEQETLSQNFTFNEKENAWNNCVENDHTEKKSCIKEIDFGTCNMCSICLAEIEKDRIFSECARCKIKFHNVSILYK
jgi:hypothetical protein